MNALETLENEFARQNKEFRDTTSECWKDHKHGHMVPIQPEYYHNAENNCDYVRIARCPVCGATMSNFTFAQWLKNRANNAQRTLKIEVPDQRHDAQADYKRTLEEAQKTLNMRLAEIEATEAEAKEDLQTVTEAKRELARLRPSQKLTKNKQFEVNA